MIITAFVLSAQAQDNKKTFIIKPPRPKVGVVLGGGGAKGAAHIGVLKYLEEAGIPIDYVAGTSMGSIIGGLYAMGYSPDELALLIAGMNWSEFVGNSIDRSAMSEDVRRRYESMVVNIPFSINALLKGKDKDNAVGFLPSAYVNNTALINLFNDLCVGYQKEMDFNDLPIPFACVATDIRTGKEVDIRHGSVPTAMRASMAIPGMFAPVVIDKHVLVDGGLVNNFPADLLKEMGADIIIGVDVSDADTAISAEYAVTLPDVLNGLINNAVNSKRFENRDLCDIYITPDITGYSTLSFSHDAIDSLVHRGYNKAKSFQVQLAAIKQHLEEKNGAPITKRLRAEKAKNLANESVYISSIVINQQSGIKSDWLLRKGKLKVGKYISEKDINHAVETFRGTGAFNEITYNLTENEADTTHDAQPESYTLTMNFKPTQPHVFGLGLRYDTEEGAAMLLNVGLNEKRLSGFKLDITGKLSYNPKFDIRATYSSPNLANFNLTYGYRSEHYKAKTMDENYSNFHFDQHKVSLYVSQFNLTKFNSTIGASLTFNSFDHVSTFDFSNDSINNEILSLPDFQSNILFSPFLNINYDNRDHEYFAKYGINTTLKGRVHIDVKGNASTTQDLSYSIQGYITPMNGRLTIIPQLYARCLFNNSQYANLRNTIGGEIEGRHFEHQMPFIGVSHIDNVNDLAVILRCDLRYNFIGKHYVMATYNFLYNDNLFGENPKVIGKRFYSGAGLRYAYDSFIGPISLTAQWSNITKNFSLYLSIGYTF